MKIILTSIGNFQPYILDNIKNLHLHNNDDITVITENKFFNKFTDCGKIELINKDELYDYNFSSNSKLDRQFRDGFVHYCSLRLFYVCSYMEKYTLTNCIHIENDVLIYYDLNKPLFNSQKVCLCFDYGNRVIPSIIYIPNSEILKYILDKYDFNKNDMENLGVYDNNLMEKLPIFSVENNIDIINQSIENFKKYNIIFDGAAMGQYLGGVDPRNIIGDTRGFVNETCMIKYDKYTFYWKKINTLYYPYINVNDNLIPIFNLHIHSKTLHKFLSDNPIEDKYIKKI